MANNILGYCTPLLVQLDKSKYTADERIEQVKELLEIEELGGAQFAADFWLDIFEQTSKDGIDTSYIKASLNQGDQLYTDTYVAKMLEIISTYILEAPEEKEKEKIEAEKERIKIYHSKELFQRAIQEKEKINDLILTAEENLTFDILVKQKNYYIAKDIKFTDKDIQSSEHMKSYKQAIDLLSERNRELSTGEKLTKEELRTRRLIRNHIGQMRNDMLQTFISEHRPIVFKAPLSNDNTPDWDMIDMFDGSQIMELLKMKTREDELTDLDLVLWDLDNLIEATDFTDTQWKVLCLYRDGLGLSEIGQKLGKTKQAVLKILRRAVDKIAEKYEEVYSDWYYLNIAKGEYKTCKTCGEPKLVSRFYKQGNSYRANCRECSRDMSSKRA